MTGRLTKMTLYDPKQTLALTRQGKISYDAMVDHAANATFRMVRQIAQTPSPDE